MLRIELVGLLLLACTQILTEHRDHRESRDQYGYHQRFHDLQERITREVRVKEGRLRGMVIQPRTNYNLQLVDVFLGVPYAEPPVGSFRFSPPRSPQPWRGVRQSQEFAPVCPQVLPNLREEVKPGRYEYLERHLPYLRNQSEDCLYLNIYAPHQAEGNFDKQDPEILGKTFISDNLRLRKKFRSLGSSIRSPRYEQRSKEIGFVTSESETVRFHQFRVLEFREIHVRPQRLRLMARVAKVAPVSSSSSLYCYFRLTGIASHTSFIYIGKDG
ncbi:Neuroligin-1 [Atta colombica]|uniref:Neuroligin-1 n=1 Tax=Atta colombica TaxID=520822 RepID=A0A195AZR3_9HYME|nr:Neuroligin-1 [Atta colombica]